MKRKPLPVRVITGLMMLSLLSSCTSCNDAGFGNIKSGRWYAGQLGNVQVFIQLVSGNKKQWDGVAFEYTGNTVVEKGSIRITTDGLELNTGGNTKQYKGRWEVKPDKLTFSCSDNDVGVVTFILQPEQTLPDLPERYSKPLFSRVSREEVEYGSAEGFYVSKAVEDMNANSYPEILSNVLNGIGGNLLTSELTLRMDIYQPEGDTASSRPLLLLIHGGAFIVGDKRDDLQVRLSNRYAKMGYVVASINYRMGYLFIPGAYFNLERCIYRAVQDSRAALRFLKHYRKKYRINPDQMFVAGNSAGGFIALKTAFMSESERYSSTEGNLFLLQDDLGCLDCSGNKFKEKIQLKGVIGLWGALTDIDMLDAYERLPMLLVHGDADRIVPYGYDFPFKNIDEQITSFFMNKVYGSKPIYDKARNEKFPVRLYTVKNGQHEPQVDENNRYTPEMGRIENEMDSFLLSNLSPRSIAIETRAGNRFVIPSLTSSDQVYWAVQGGCIVSSDRKGSVQVVAFKGEKKCVLQAVVVSSNGMVSKSSHEISTTQP